MAEPEAEVQKCVCEWVCKTCGKEKISPYEESWSAAVTPNRWAVIGSLVDDVPADRDHVSTEVVLVVGVRRAGDYNLLHYVTRSGYPGTYPDDQLNPPFIEHIRIGIGTESEYEHEEIVDMRDSVARELIAIGKERRKNMAARKG